MPRLDVWLVEQGHFTSRQTAKRAIQDGLVTIDGKPAKPSSIVRGKEDIKVLDDFLDRPVGYDKLKQLVFLLSNSSISKDNLVLDIGSSAGGFLRFLAEKGTKVIGIEISDSFKEELTIIVNQFPNTSVIIDNAFKIDPLIICAKNELDLLLVDVTTDTEGTLKLIGRFTPLLKKNGYIIAAFKSKPNPTVINEIKIQVKGLGFTDIRETILNESLQEFHILAVRA
jgi:23S rRNA (cytidine1920-2'-O)/16S rRNA (cytidine1409-2'-O)-methyltransferase